MSQARPTGCATKRPRSAVAIAVVALVGVALSACSSADDRSAVGADGLKKLVVVLDWTPNTNHSGMYLARDKGWYEEAGLDVEFVEPGDSSSLQLLAAGKADVAVSVQEELIPARAEGLPVKSIGAIIQHNTSSLVSLSSDGIEGPADLAGKTYGGYGGALETALIDRLIDCAGGEAGSVNSVDVGEADYRIGLERDQYDFVWIFDGWDGIRLKNEGVDTNELPFIDQDGCIPDWYTPLLASSEKMEQDRPEDLRAFMSATTRGYTEAMDDPAAAADALMLGAPDLDRKLVEDSAEYLSTRYADVPEDWGRQTEEIWVGFADFLLDAGLVTEKVDVESAWTNEYLPDGG